VASRLKHAVVISGEEATVNRTFLTDFWTAQEKQVSLLDSPTDTDNADGEYVSTGGGDLPISFLENIVMLPEFAFTLTEMNPL
jgi:hypothetical protein